VKKGSASRTRWRRGREETAEVTGGGDGCRTGGAATSGGGLAPTVAAAPIIEVRAWDCLEAVTATTLAIEGFMGATGDRRRMAGGRWTVSEGRPVGEACGCHGRREALEGR
jgi:hypothetical protein